MFSFFFYWNVLGFSNINVLKIFSKKGLTLPGGDNLSEEDQNKIIESILYFYKSKRVK